MNKVLESAIELLLDLIKARLARSALVCLQSTPLLCSLQMQPLSSHVCTDYPRFEQMNWHGRVLPLVLTLTFTNHTLHYLKMQISGRTTSTYVRNDRTDFTEPRLLFSSFMVKSRNILASLN